MDMRKAWRIRDDCVRDEGLSETDVILASALDPVLDCLVRTRDPETVSCFVARSPAALDHLGDLPPPLADVSAAQSIETRHEAGILDHESHEFCWIATDAEEFEAILFDELLERRVCR